MKLIKRILGRLGFKRLAMSHLDKLIERGLVVGANFNMRDGCIIDASHCWHITIGNDVTFAPRVHLLAHDASTKVHLGYTRIGRVKIGDRVFIGATATVLPGVEIGDDVVIGSGSVVTRSIPSGMLAAGNPARVICSTEEYLDKKRQEMASVPNFGEEYTISAGVSESMKEEMNNKIGDGIGYVV